MKMRLLTLIIPAIIEIFFSDLHRVQCYIKKVIIIIRIHLTMYELYVSQYIILRIIYKYGYNVIYRRR